VYLIKIRLFTVSLYASTGVDLRLQSYIPYHTTGSPDGIDTPIVVVLLVWLCCRDINAEVAVTVLTASCVRV
jgi:hypothetical protein